jgi:hypothetical protein
MIDGVLESDLEIVAVETDKRFGCFLSEALA